MSLDALFSASNLYYELSTLLKTLRSQFSEETAAAIVDSKGDLVCAEIQHPIELTCFSAVIKNVTKYIRPLPGELLLTNDPYSGVPKINDLFFAKPVFSRNDVSYYVILKVSLPQLLKTSSPELFKKLDDEGVRIPPSALDTAGQVKMAIIEFLGSIADKAELKNLFDKVESKLSWAATQVQSIPISEKSPLIKKYTESLIQEMFTNLPDGEFTAQEFLDDDGYEKGPIKIQAKVSIHDKNVLVSFAGTHRQIKGPYNCTYPMTFAACLWPFLCLIGKSFPLNETLLSFLTVEALDGTLVNASNPSALIGGYYETAQRISDCVQLALAKALPQQIPALSGGSTNPHIFCFESGKTWTMTMSSGVGASSRSAGPTGLAHGLHNFSQEPMEILENTYPVRILHHNIRTGSGGHGRNAGGAGLTRGIQVLEPAKLWCLSDRRQLKAHGLVGGTSGNAGDTIVISQGKRDKGPPFKRFIQLQAGDVVIIDTPGGGGWGKTLDSDEE